MDLEALFETMSATKLFGMTLASLTSKALLVVVVFVAASVADRIATRLVRKALTTAEVPSGSILINILRVIIWAFALMTILEPIFGIQPTAFLAALGIGSVALSLGLQDTISNIIGGLTLMLSKVIVVGDVVKVGDFTGKVIDINWRSTSLRDAYDQVNVIPNSVLSKTALVKLSDYTRSRCQITLVIKHGVDLNDVVADVAREARDILGSRVDNEMGVEVFISGFDAFGIQATANVHLIKGADFDECRTMLAARLIGRPWVAQAH